MKGARDERSKGVKANGLKNEKTFVIKLMMLLFLRAAMNYCIIPLDFPVFA
jgi:hypothetical protein